MPNNPAVEALTDFEHRLYLALVGPLEKHLNLDPCPAIRLANDLARDVAAVVAATAQPADDLMQRKAAALDWLERTTKDDRYYNDVMVQYDDEDGIWVSLRTKGEEQNLCIEGQERHTEDLLVAIESAMAREVAKEQG